MTTKTRTKIKLIKLFTPIFIFLAIIGGGVYEKHLNDTKLAYCASLATGHRTLLSSFNQPVQAKEAEEKTEAEKIEEFGLLLFGEEDWKLMRRIIKCESGWNTKAVSHTGDTGLTQINWVHGIRQDWLKNWRVNLVVAHELWEAQGATPWRSSYPCHKIK